MQEENFATASSPKSSSKVAVAEGSVIRVSRGITERDEEKSYCERLDLRIQKASITKVR